MTAFPDAFVLGLKTQLTTAMTSPVVSTYPCPTNAFFTRPLRPDDPNLSVSVFEGDVSPVEYEIGHGGVPTTLRWDVAVQVFVKAANEEDGRATRSLLLSRVRATLFSNTTATALNTLVDAATGERVMKYRLRRIAFASGDLHGGSKFFVGQAEVFFETEMP